ncbi:MAG TPA: methyltransferase domain-containing protein, partial [Ktedonobacterales bacterium]
AFDAVTCQTVLTHVADPALVVREMARMLAPGGAFLAIEYTDTGALNGYNPCLAEVRDDDWRAEVFRILRLFRAGKRALGRGDETLGARVPFLAMEAGLDVYDIRLNDHVLHALPPIGPQESRMRWRRRASGSSAPSQRRRSAPGRRRTFSPVAERRLTPTAMLSCSSTPPRSRRCAPHSPLEPTAIPSASSPILPLRASKKPGAKPCRKPYGGRADVCHGSTNPNA